MDSLPLANLAATETLARKIAALARPGDIITLRGQLGTGKTTFARAFIRHFDSRTEEVISPTFSLLQVYETPTAEIWHLDLYRLKSPEEAIELGLEDGFNRAVLLIEWPEIIEHLLPSDRLDITLEYGTKTEERTASLRSAPKWQKV